MDGIGCTDAPSGRTMMRAAEADRYGPPEVLRIVQVEKPAPAPDEVLVRIHAAAVTMSDIFIRSGRVTPLLFIPFRLMIGITRPRAGILGFAYAGVVEETGSATTRFSPGDEVYGMTGYNLQAYAEYRCAKESETKRHGCLALKPKNLTFPEATAAIYGGSLALQYVDNGHIKPGDRVLIYGASGTSGTIAVQYAKHLGAHVTAVCSGRNAELVISLGADEVLDYTTVAAPPEGVEYNFVMDSVGGTRTSPLKRACRQALAPGGRSVSIDDGDLTLEISRIDRIRELVEAGAITPVLGHTFPFDQIVEAHRLVESGHKRGGVAVSIGIT
jgi:NADPH:quinone reductase-like Zn-dependent oxidoreductase